MYTGRVFRALSLSDLFILPEIFVPGHQSDIIKQFSTRISLGEERKS